LRTASGDVHLHTVAPHRPPARRRRASQRSHLRLGLNDPRLQKRQLGPIAPVERKIDNVIRADDMLRVDEASSTLGAALVTTTLSAVCPRSSAN